MAGFTTVDEYIAGYPEDVRERLGKVRETIREALPQAQEKISYMMPTYWQGKNLIHFAAFKQHIGLYPGGEATAVFADKLQGYKTSKGTVQFPLDKPMPYELIAEIARWCARYIS